MILKILLASASVFGIYWAIKTKKQFPAIITLGMVVGISIVLFLPVKINLTGFYVYMAFVALAFIYGLVIKEKQMPERLIICLLATSIFVYWLWILNHWHGIEVLAAILALFVSIAGVFKIRKLKDELGFLSILAVDAIVILLEVWMKHG
ncbi:MAG: hypothetical protein ACOYN4_19560 [Bacteroidales bacterium]